jgi:hypothetical protein
MRREKGGGEAGKNYRGSRVRKGGRGSSTLHMFLSFSVVILFIDRTKKPLRRCLSGSESENQGRIYLFSYTAIKILCKGFFSRSGPFWGGGLEKRILPQLETALGGPGYSFTCRHFIRFSQFITSVLNV